LDACAVGICHFSCGSLAGGESLLPQQEGGRRVVIADVATIAANCTPRPRIIRSFTYNAGSSTRSSTHGSTSGTPLAAAAAAAVCLHSRVGRRKLLLPVRLHVSRRRDAAQPVAQPGVVSCEDGRKRGGVERRHGREDGELLGCERDGLPKIGRVHIAHGLEVLEHRGRASGGVPRLLAQGRHHVRNVTVHLKSSASTPV
jgi:hypothetical protein